MQIVLDIKNESDLALLLPLLERLKIPFTYPKNSTGTEVSKPEKEAASVKNFDPEKLQALFAHLQKMNAFAQIQDPVSWQKQQRDEWN